MGFLHRNAIVHFDLVGVCWRATEYLDAQRVSSLTHVLVLQGLIFTLYNT